MSHGTAQRDESPEERIAALEAELASVRRAHDHKALELERAQHEREQYRKLYELVLFELERLKRQLFGKKAESVDPKQVQLAFEPVFEALARAEKGENGAQEDVKAELAKLQAAAEQARQAADSGKPNSPNGGRGKGHGRRNFGAERAPVETIVLEPPERHLPGAELLVKIDEEVSEHFDYRPATIVRVRVVRPKYRKPEPMPGTSPIAIAELPERPIPRSVAGPGLIAHVITQKYADHVPLHRQQVIFQRQGVHLPRSTLANLVQGGAALLDRIVDAMWRDARERAAWIAIDATGVLVLAAEQCRRGHFWVVVAERDHVLFRYTPKHDGTVPAELLAGFTGYVIADASSVYHELYRSEPGIIEVACWAHARRRFYDALGIERERAMVGIGFIGLLYDAHDAATDPTTGVVDTEKRRPPSTITLVDRLMSHCIELRSENQQFLRVPSNCCIRSPSISRCQARRRDANARARRLKSSVSARRNRLAMIHRVFAHSAPLIAFWPAWSSAPNTPRGREDRSLRTIRRCRAVEAEGPRLRPAANLASHRPKMSPDGT